MKKKGKQHLYNVSNKASSPCVLCVCGCDLQRSNEEKGEREKRKGGGGTNTLRSSRTWKKASSFVISINPHTTIIIMLPIPCVLQ